SSRRRHTRSDRDWSSDGALPIYTGVDLLELGVHHPAQPVGPVHGAGHEDPATGDGPRPKPAAGVEVRVHGDVSHEHWPADLALRSEERRVGKEGATGWCGGGGEK